MVRTTLPLTGKWRFGLDLMNAGEDERWFRTDFDDGSWLLVDVPSNWDYYKLELFGYAGVGWFRRRFNACKEWSARQVILKFEGVNYSAKVWVNGVLVGSHEGGFVPFEFDISDRASFGEENLIAVKVDNLPSEDRVPSSLGGWWNYGGIYRDVYLEARPFLHVDDVSVRAEPEGEVSQVAVLLKIANESSEARHVRIEAKVATAAGEVILDGGREPKLSQDAEIPAGTYRTYETKITVKGMRRWSPEEPNVYVLSVFLTTPEGELLDMVSTIFGVRKIAVRDGRLHLNDEPLRIKGVNRHEEYPGTGRTDRDNLTESDLRMIKDDLGANVVRIHYQCESRFYELADRLGLLVFAEIPAWQISKEAFMDPKVVENAKQQLATLISRLKNHPSVVVWSVGNECESDNETARGAISDLIRFVKERDSTRPATYVSNYIYNTERWCRCLDLGDFTSINAYFDLQVDRLRQVLARIRKENPGRAVLVTEFGAEAVRGVHGGFIGSEEHQADVIEKTWNLLSSEDVMGGLVWSLTDYWHQPRRLGTPCLNPVYFLHGILDLERRPKRAYKVLRRLYSGRT